MPRFIIERNFAEQLEPTRYGVTALTQINTDVGVHWLFSFLSADKKGSSPNRVGKKVDLRG